MAKKNYRETSLDDEALIKAINEIGENEEKGEEKCPKEQNNQTQEQKNYEVTAKLVEEIIIKKYGKNDFYAFWGLMNNVTMCYYLIELDVSFSEAKETFEQWFDADNPCHELIAQKFMKAS